MDRRQLLAGAAWLVGSAQANAFGVGQLGRGMGHGGLLGGAKAASGPKYGEIFYQRSFDYAPSNDITIVNRIKAAAFAGTPASAKTGAYVSMRGVCRKSYIGNAGSAANFSATPVQLLFGGLATVLDTGAKLVTSDLANFTWDGSSDVIISQEFLASDGIAITRKQAGLTGVVDTYYKLSAPGDSGTVTKSGYTLLTNQYTSIEAVRLAGFTLAATDRSLHVVCDGDSLTAGNGADGPAHNYPAIMRSLLRYTTTIDNLGVGGAQASDRQAANSTGPLFTAGAKAVLWAGSNDLKNLQNPTTAYNNYVSWCNFVKAQGYRVVAVTMLPRNDTVYAGFEADRQTFNTNVRNNYLTFAHALADPGNDATIGIPGAYSNAAVYNADLVHLIGPGYEIATGIISPAVLAA